MKRILLVILSLALAVVPAFANGGAEEMESTGPVEIEFWTTQTQSERQATIQVLVDTFQVMNPDITVNVIPVDENDMATQINSAAAAGTLPDLIEAATPNTVAFGSAGLLNQSAATDLINEIGAD